MMFIVNFVVLALLVFGALALSSSGSVLGSGPEVEELPERKNKQDQR